MDFQLEYQLLEAGWASAKITLGSVVHTTAVSYLTRDPLGDFAKALIEFLWPDKGSVFVFGNANPEDLKRRSFDWENEPGGWRWTLRPLADRDLQVKIEELGSGGRPKEVLVDHTFPIATIASALVGCIEALVLKHGLVGYRLSWMEGDLPIAQYLMLKRWLQSPSYDPKTAKASWQDDLALLGSVHA